MNSWTVIWQRSAELGLAAIWNEAKNKSMVTQAAHQLEQALSRNPMTFGESRAGLQRMAFEKPLCINFEVIPDDHKVIVISVREC